MAKRATKETRVTKRGGEEIGRWRMREGESEASEFVNDIRVCERHRGGEELRVILVFFFSFWHFPFFSVLCVDKRVQLTNNSLNPLINASCWKSASIEVDTYCPT